MDLSRRDGGVTIFISTHFMNEALRCDRISLMHAGEVMVVGTPPDEIAATSPSGTLEEAFIHQIETAIAVRGGLASNEGQGQGQDVEQTEPTPDTVSGTGARARKQHVFSVSRMGGAIALREWREVLRDPIRLAFAFLGSIFLLVVFAQGISMDVDEITIAALDQDQTPPASRQYLSAYYSSDASWSSRKS